MLCNAMKKKKSYCTKKIKRKKNNCNITGKENIWNGGIHFSKH